MFFVELLLLCCCYVFCGVVFGVFGGVVVIVMLFIVQLIVNVGYDEVVEGFDDVLWMVCVYQMQMEYVIVVLIEKIDVGYVIFDIGSFVIVVFDDVVVVFVFVVDDGEGVGVVVEDVVVIELLLFGDKLMWFWEFYGVMVELGVQQQDFDCLVVDFDDQIQNVQDIV